MSVVLSTFTLLWNRRPVFYILQIWDSISIKPWLSFLPSSRPRHPPFYSAPMNLITLGAIWKWNHTAFVLWLASYPQSSSMLHMLQYFLTFLRWIKSRCIYLLRFVHPFIHQGPFGWLPPPSCSELWTCELSWTIVLLWTWVWESLWDLAFQFFQISTH